VPFPYGATDRDFFQHHIENASRDDVDLWVFGHDRQRASTLEADLEADVCQSKDQAVSGALTATYSHHARNPTSDSEVLVWVEEGVGQCADVLRRHFLQATNRVGRD
jgi:hypothetical protein